MNTAEIIDVLKKEIAKSPYIECYPLDKKDLVFEERVKLNCFYCSRYNTKWTCPPKMPELDFKKIMMEYENLLVLVYRRKFKKENYEIIRTESTNAIHRKLLELEAVLYNLNKSMAVSFLGGVMQAL